jgi:hypothetical protein
MAQVRVHVEQEIPEIANWGASESTLSRLFVAPHGGHTSKALYKGLIDMRAPSKDDTIRKPNKNQHACAAHLKYVTELASAHPTECHFFSNDDKAQVCIGGMVVSNFVKIRRLYPTGDRPRHPDHKFVVATAWSLTISGIIEVLAHPWDVVVEGKPTQQGEVRASTITPHQPAENSNIFRVRSDIDATALVSVQSKQRAAEILGLLEQDSDTDVVIADLGNGDQVGFG